jgi:hypothetical protein
MAAYDYKAVNKFASLALQKGVKTIDVIVAEYEQTFLLKPDKIYHYNIILKADEKEVSILDLKFPKHSKEHRSRAYEEAKAAMKKLKDWHLEAYALPKFVEYSWFFAKPLLNKPITNKP